jgi:hypothetical protein
VLLNQFTDSVDLFSAEAAATFEADGVEPEFRLTLVPFDVDVRPLAPSPA